MYNYESMKNISIIFLILSNAVPLAGVAFFDWSIFSILFFYWFENIAIGFFTILRLIKSEGSIEGLNMIFNGKPVDASNKVALVGFFIFHFGLFTLLHGVFIFEIFGPSTIALTIIIWTGILFFISHGTSYKVNFIGKKEYKRVPLRVLFSQPYKRIMVIHLTIIFGAFFINSFDEPIMALVVMILVKIILDVLSHRKEHKKFQFNT